jgi:purine catabolism regulator
LDAVSRVPTEPPLTVDATLRLPALRRGAPEVLAGGDELGRVVGWAHSCEARHIPALLEGGEVLLMTGMGLATTPPDQRAFVRDLAERRVAALVIELGHIFQAVPDALVQEARRLHLPLIALHREVRFVEVTKQVHTAILSRQLTVERRSAELQARLTAMLLDGAAMPAILGDLARAVGNPVLLERAGGEVLFHAAGRADPEDLLAHRELLRAADDDDRADGAAVVEVAGAGGRAWGRLVAVPHERPVDAQTLSALHRVAPLIAMALQRAGEERLLGSRERGNFLHDAMTGRIAVEDLPARAARLGLAEGAAAGRLLGVVVAWRTQAGAASAVDERRWLAALRDVREALRAWGIGALIGSRPTGADVVMLLALPPGLGREAAVERVVDALAAAELGPGTVAAGPLTRGWDGVPAGLRAAADAAETMRDAPPRRWHDATVADVERLLWGLRDDEKLAAFARRRLAPVLEHDRAHGAPLLPTLDALCDRHWHKAQTARALGIQRQSVYARIERLRGVLGADLDDPEVRLGLELAVRALRVVGR